MRYIDRVAKEDYKKSLKLQRSAARSLYTSPLSASQKLRRKGPKKLPARKRGIDTVRSLHRCVHKHIPAGSVKPLCNCQRSFGCLAEEQILRRKHEVALAKMRNDQEKGIVLKTRYEKKVAQKARDAEEKKKKNAMEEREMQKSS